MRAVQHETVATLATIPARAALVPRVLTSLHGQVDALHVAFDTLPGSPSDPAWLQGVLEAYEKQTWRAPTLRVRGTHLGDAAKLLALDVAPALTPDTVVLTCDDDFEYPPDYAAFLVQALHTAEARVGGSSVIVSLHGDRFSTSQPTTFRRHRVAVQQCGAPQRRYFPEPHLLPAHVLGTGVAAARASVWRDFRRTLSERAARNCLDLHVAAWCERHAVPRFVVALPRASFLRYLLPKDAPTIWTAAVTEPEDTLVRSTSWKPL